jgi:hypothetical protein
MLMRECNRSYLTKKIYELKKAFSANVKTLGEGQRLIPHRHAGVPMTFKANQIVLNRIEKLTSINYANLLYY